MLSAVQLANIVVEKGQSLAELAKEMPKYPQLLKNLRVEDKMAMMTNVKILEEIVDIEEVRQELEKIENDINVAKARHNEFLKELGLNLLP